MGIQKQVIDVSKLKATCSNCNLHELCLPRGLNAKDLIKSEYVVKGSRPIQKGYTIFRAGDAFISFYIVRSGSVKVFIHNESGEEQIVGFYFPGDIIGFDAIEQHQHSCSAVAMEMTTFCSLPYNKIINVCLETPELQKQLLRLISREISIKNKLLLIINTRTAEERIAIFLVTLSSRFHKLGYSAIEYNLPMSRQEIGNYLGLAVETVSRLFTKFQQNGLVTINRKAIRLENLPALHSMCDGFIEKSNINISAARI
jgi:CRP/FNR family transcriptional regulator, anaerobic regulatory protein